MPRTNLLSATFFVALTLVTTSAFAWPFGRVLHLHPARAAAKDSRIAFAIDNKSGVTQNLDITGHKYTLLPNASLNITAPEGTQVISETSSSDHNKGDVLFAVQPTLRNETVIIR